jgi:L-alanine-DL-glutamate epimerase-like enolase superfamily enzyme
MTEAQIAGVRVATVRAPLPEVIRFGPWVMEHREFALCRVETTAGAVGHAFVYTRDGPIAAFVARNIAPMYVGERVDNPAELHWRAAWSNNAILASGLGLRALSLVDLAVWDLFARLQNTSVTRLLGGEPRPLPATAIIGYPPTLTADEVHVQVDALLADGWRRFKQPIAATPEATRQRLEAARLAMGPDCWLGMDCNWVFKTAQEAIDFATTIRKFDLDWIEDVVPPGDAALVAAIRAGAGIPIAMGDEQGGSYHPESLLAHDAVDVVRVDVSTNGGLTRLKGILDRIEKRGVRWAPHMFGHMHSQAFAGLGYTEVPIEWGVVGSGVDQFADSLRQPVIRDGLMEPLPERPGFGLLVNPEWAREQIVDDPDEILTMEWPTDEE